MRIAEILQVDFKFTWTGLSTWSMDFNNVHGHSIAKPDAFFEKRFLERHLLDPRDVAEMPQQLRSGPISLQELREQFDRDGGIRVGSSPALNVLLSSAFPATTFELLDCYDRIEFSEPIRKAIEAARQVETGDSTTALHLRSGDLVFGEWRKKVQWTRKCMSIPIAKAMIKEAKGRGNSVAVFGTDQTALEYLHRECGATNGAALSADFEGEAERAMFEITLISRASEIFGGSSAFATLSSNIGGVPIRRPEQVLNGPVREEASIKDLSENANQYDPFQTAFAYWYLYFDQHKRRTSRANIEWLNKAQQYDPENQLYLLVKAALLYKIEADDEAENIVKYALSDEIGRGRSELLSVLCGNIRGNMHLHEFHPYIREAWIRQRPFASFLQAAVEHASGNRKNSRNILRKPPAQSLGAEILALAPT